MKVTLLRQTLLQILQLDAIRQTSKPKQIASLFKSGMLGQFVNVDTAIGKNAAVTIDITDAGAGGNNALHAFGCLSAGHAGHSLSLN